MSKGTLLDSFVRSVPRRGCLNFQPRRFSIFIAPIIRVNRESDRRSAKEIDRTRAAVGDPVEFGIPVPSPRSMSVFRQLWDVDRTLRGTPNTSLSRKVSRNISKSNKFPNNAKHFQSKDRVYLGIRTWKLDRRLNCQWRSFIPRLHAILMNITYDANLVSTINRWKHLQETVERERRRSRNEWSKVARVGRLRVLVSWLAGWSHESLVKEKKGRRREKEKWKTGRHRS